MVQKLTSTFKMDSIRYALILVLIIYYSMEIDAANANTNITNSVLTSPNVTSCNLDTKNSWKTREFATLVEYQGNRISFNPSDSDFLGNRLNFSFQSISRLNKNAFVSYTSEYVFSCDLSAKYIKRIDDGAFFSLSCLQFLDLSYNMITILNTDMFLGLNNLKLLNLRYNLINYLPADAFNNMPKLEALDISHNNISEMHKFTFDRIPYLKILDLSHNFMKHIQYMYFNNLGDLEQLYLDHNAIAIIHTNLFSKNTKLRKLDLSVNGMVLLYIVKYSFNPETFQVFNISNNYLLDLNLTEWIDEFSNFKTIIDLNENQFCCKDWKFYIWNLKKYNITIAPGRNFTANHNVNGILCDNLNYTFPNGYKESIEALHRDLDNVANSTLSGEEEDIDPHRTDQFARMKNIIHHEDAKETTHLSFKYVFIVLAIIGIGFCVFLAIDYLLGVGLRQMLTQRVHIWLSRPYNNANNINSHYVQLQPTS
ncbi:unnamed protein product [Ceutorhynchus assimilis]|uniref:Uncharacterized protein n=1 Tax=Ceutorhynchus assimilis TaxID=467358 RepID=A0A9N9Q901_9CUCU|nr:unnamed protein product [Ceutorhynchus assimilis]